MKVLNVVGARPNFMKVAPLHRTFLKHSGITSKIVHTGQHYDERMSKIFFDQLELPEPDYYLGVGSGSHAVITAKIMIAFEKIILEEKPDLVLVVGDVNSTLACALVTKKLNIKLAHVEAGLRSEDRTMPEELNRIMTDSISDYLFVTEQSGLTNLAKENIPNGKIFFVGNVMIDSLCFYQKKALKLSLLEKLNLTRKGYVLMTMHRPANVDQSHNLSTVVDMIEQVSKKMPVVLPLHPRTAKQLQNFSLKEKINSIPNLILLEPQGYLEFINLMNYAALIITDSGGVQEESTFLGVPCLTIRKSTERPITVTHGTNVLIPELKVDLILAAFENTLCQDQQDTMIPPFWDGKTAPRIVQHLLEAFEL